MTFFILTIYSIVFGIATSYVAGQKGKNKSTWFLIGILLGIIGLLMIGFSKESPKEDTESRKKSHNSVHDNKLYNLTTNLDAPLDVIWNSVMILDNKVVLHTKFKNISDKPIEAIKYEVECFNSFNQHVNEMENNLNEVIIQDLNLLPNNMFKPITPLDLSDYPTTRKVNVVLKNALFLDGSIWSSEGSDILKTKSGHSVDEENLKLLRNLVGNDFNGLFEMENDRWICICGRNNSLTINSCSRCHRDKEYLMKKFSFENIQSTITDINIKNNKQNKEIMIKEKKTKQLINKRIKIVSLMLLTIIIMIGTYYFTQVYIPQQNIMKSDRLYDEGQYEEALDLMEKAMDRLHLVGQFR